MCSVAGQQAAEPQIALHTFAFCHDHESAAVSVCADTAENSRRVVDRINRFNMKYFIAATRGGDLTQAALWQANVGRSLSLGDFAFVNVTRRDLGSFSVAPGLHVAMLRATLACAADIEQLAPDRGSFLCACSTGDDEVGLVWTPVALDAAD